jgi:hypothetical protein
MKFLVSGFVVLHEGEVCGGRGNGLVGYKVNTRTGEHCDRVMVRILLNDFFVHRHCFGITHREFFWRRRQ